MMSLHPLYSIGSLLNHPSKAYLCFQLLRMQKATSVKSSKPLPTLRPLSLLQKAFKPRESTSIVNSFSFTKPNFSELGYLEPKTASYFLAISVKKHTTLKTIIEDEESDFSEEFSKPLPTLISLSLFPRLQKVLCSVLKNRHPLSIPSHSM